MNRLGVEITKNRSQYLKLKHGRASSSTIGLRVRMGADFHFRDRVSIVE